MLISSAHNPAYHVVVMGVSGSGKTSVGIELAALLGVEFLDGDDLHPRANIEKMESGRPLDDFDRAPWLQAISLRLADAPQGLVVGCSALKRSYRDLIRTLCPDAVFVHLTAPFGILLERMRTRPGHFMPPELLHSQFDALESLETDERGHAFDVTQPARDVAVAAASWLRGELKEGSSTEQGQDQRKPD